ncbi:MAG: hypothetical protein V4819_22470 [Verrucomicrobiota bacterium]
MDSLVVALLVLVSPLHAESKDPAVSLKRFAELRKQSESITKATSEKDVVLILGKPQSKGTGGWGNLDTTVWHYLDYTDDSLHRSFSVWFDPKAGCSVSQVELSRKEIAKSPLLVSIGEVLLVYPNYPEKGSNGFLCDVRFKDDRGELMIGVAVETLDRVKGAPEIGATIRVEHRGGAPDYIFVSAHSLYLESMVFTNHGKQVSPSEEGKPKN